jgi:hypothetical protein
MANCLQRLSRLFCFQAAHCRGHRHQSELRAPRGSLYFHRSTGVGLCAAWFSSDVASHREPHLFPEVVAHSRHRCQSSGLYACAIRMDGWQVWLLGRKLRVIGSITGTCETNVSGPCFSTQTHRGRLGNGSPQFVGRLRKVIFGLPCPGCSHRTGSTTIWSLDHGIPGTRCAPDSGVAETRGHSGPGYDRNPGTV